MTLTEIRRRTGYSEEQRQTVKGSLRAWLGGTVERKFTLGVTLMPKKVFVKTVPGIASGKVIEIYRHMNKAELIEAGNRFKHELNKLVYKQAYRRHGKKLNIVYSVEGEKSCKDLHLHFAVGGQQSTMRVLELKQFIENAIRNCGDFVILNDSYKEGIDDVSDKYRYKIDVIDSGWIDYITKELNRDCIENVQF